MELNKFRDKWAGYIAGPDRQEFEDDLAALEAGMRGTLRFVIKHSQTMTWYESGQIEDERNLVFDTQYKCMRFAASLGYIAEFMEDKPDEHTAL